jgi:hypothetical protein
MNENEMKLDYASDRNMTTLKPSTYNEDLSSQPGYSPPPEQSMNRTNKPLHHHNQIVVSSTSTSYKDASSLDASVIAVAIGSEDDRDRVRVPSSLE